MDLVERERLLKNWRGRRLLACRAFDDVHSVIDALASDDGSQCPPVDGLPSAPSFAIRSELQNTAANLLRLILLHNDGAVSSSRLQRF